MYQTREHTFSRQSLKMRAWLAEANTTEKHAADHEFLANQMIEGHASSHDVTSGVARVQLDALIATQRFDGFDFDEGDLSIWARLIGIGAHLFEISISLEPLTSDCLYLS
jgi:hypothetical protein